MELLHRRGGARFLLYACFQRLECILLPRLSHMGRCWPAFAHCQALLDRLVLSADPTGTHWFSFLIFRVTFKRRVGSRWQVFEPAVGCAASHLNDYT